MFHKKNKSHSLAFNAGPLRVVANCRAPFRQCGNLPAPLSRAARNFSIIVKTLRSWRLCVRLIKSPHSGNSNTLMLKTIAVSPALWRMQVEHFCVKNIPALQGKELFRIVPQKKQIQLLSLQRRSPTCHWEPSRAFAGQCGNLPAPLFRSFPRAARHSSVIVKNLCGLGGFA